MCADQRSVRQRSVPRLDGRRIRRLLHAVMVGALVGSMLIVGTGCGEEDEAGDAERVTGALEAGLQAHVEGRTPEAVTRYQEVLKLDPKNKFALYNLGLISQSSGDHADAEAKYREALLIDPNYQPALFNLAIVRTAAGDLDEAISLYRRAVAADPDNASAHLNLGLLLRRTGRTAEGDAEVQRARALNPNLTDPGSG